ncbi:MAG: 1,4-alpha-glucan branching enzyme, partial [Gammaproteobacteria bacterium]|nr:1,4-alpha-glucan branching enzyme [Gammaproteobacteria bacterium]
MRFVDQCHAAGIGVIMDWVPGHFPQDEFGLTRFDGTYLYEHADPRQGEHAEWGTKVFNFGRNEVRNFLIANALFWLDYYHLDGLRVDAVASMIYLDYNRKDGQWEPNRFGGRENLEAIKFLQQLNKTIFRYHPGVLSIAEESTAFPGVSHPPENGGLGFNFKWNMGWMNDTLRYISKDPVYRKHEGDLITFSMVYAWSENFILPISHDEVVHGKGALLSKMPGDEWQQWANLRLYIAYMLTHPGKKLLFMGQEFGQRQEWSEDRSLDWHLLEHGAHKQQQTLCRDLNHFYRTHPQLFAADTRPEGFEWIECQDSENSVYAYIRHDGAGELPSLVCILNFTPIPRDDYRLGLPNSGTWKKVFDTDATKYGGAGYCSQESVGTETVFSHGREHSAVFCLPPLGMTLWQRSVADAD